MKRYEIPADIILICHGLNPQSLKHISDKILSRLADIMKFHIGPNVKLVNDLIRDIGELFTKPDYDKCDEIKEELLEIPKYISPNADIQAHREKRIAKLKALLKTAEGGEIIYSSPLVLAFAYRVIKTYPDMVPLIENAVFVERAIKYMEGSYIDHVAKASKLPTIRESDCDNHKIYTKTTHWVCNSITMCFVMLMQYGVTGNINYINAIGTFPISDYCDFIQWPMFQSVNSLFSYIDEVRNQCRKKAATKYKNTGNMNAEWVKKTIIDAASVTHSADLSKNQTSETTPPTAEVASHEPLELII